MTTTKITIKDRLDLIQKIKNGSNYAFKEYYRINEGLIRNMVRRYSKGLAEAEIDDLYQEAAIGLYKGIQKFDLSRNAQSGKPEGYIFSWVRAYLSRYIKDHILVNGKKITFIPIHHFPQDHEAFVSSNATAENEIEDPSPTPDHQYEFTELNELIADYISIYPPREQAIFKKRLLSGRGNKQSLRDLGRDFGITHERVRQIEIDLKCDLLHYLATREIVNI
mgnify:CR=1 FL=1